VSTPALSPPPPPTALRRAWAGALALFVLAGLTGVLYRFAVAFVWTPDEMGGLVLGNVRHAHSHLMYFGWATPALMALIAHAVRRRTGQPIRGIGPILGAVLALALLAYPPFLLWGYAPAVLGDARLPLSVIAAGLNVIGWYAFAVAYARATRDHERDAALRVFDLALAFLVLSTVGAWGLPLSQAAGIASEPLKAALTHLFLDTFSEGWFVLGVLGLAYAAADERRHVPPLWPVLVAAVGVPFTFALALPAGFVPPLWKGLASVGGGLVGLGLLAAVAVLWRRLGARRSGGLWRIALGLLALKATGQICVALSPGVNWAAFHGLRVLYLHLMLLGFVTLGFFAAAEAAFGAGPPGAERRARAMAVAVGLLLATLFPLTGFWPPLLGGEWALWAAAFAALGPVLVAACILMPLMRRRPVRQTFG
jgi:hypothetical protein